MRAVLLRRCRNRRLAAVPLVLVLAATPSGAPAQGQGAPPITNCPTFRVLNTDPQAGYRAGSYDMQVWGRLTCRRAVRIFQRYLANPRLLPRNWYASETQAAIVRGRTGRTGFSLSLVQRRQTRHTNGTMTNCPGTTSVTAANQASGYAPGTYIIQVFGVVSCDTASSVFRDWLANPDVSQLPPSWFPFADTPGFYYNRGAGGGFYLFRR